MIGAQEHRGRGRASRALVLLWLVAAVWAVPAAATPLHINAPLCHAVGPLAAPDDALSALRFSCSGEPTGYRDGSLWLRADVGNRSDDHNGAALMVHFSRFDRLA
ncbi:MAG: GGDEF domain-containing protein, partial [Sphingopyxis terrae]